MKYEVYFYLEYYNGSKGSDTVTFETKGKGKKVLKAHLKKYIEDFYKAPERLYDVSIIYIKKFEKLNPNNVWNKEDFENFKDKLYNKQEEEILNRFKK